MDEARLREIAERITKKIADDWSRETRLVLTQIEFDLLTGHIVAALRASQAPGMVCVPVEPTEEIVNAIVDAGVGYQGNELNGPTGYAAHIYRAMIAAAQPKEDESE